MSNPSDGHWYLLKKTVSYFYYTIDEVLTLSDKCLQEKIQIEAYVDSDYASNKDDQRSITGFVIFMDGMPLSWKSKKQPTTTLSSTEAEYVAVTHCSTEIQFILHLLKELHQKVPDPVILHEDNAGALFLAKNHFLWQRTKHIDVRYHYIRDLIDKKVVDIKYVSTEDNIADVMTKSLGESKHKKFAKKLLKGLMKEESYKVAWLWRGRMLK